ncbi:MAG TPA: aromatic amino acid transport family protein [Chlamydiales bacterium]|nr:aromatic amino acid transport family protein [Chlamydiales bacterium]
MEKSKNLKLLGAVLLIAGTAIGGGMLALPLDTGSVGFVPSLMFMLLAWSFMLVTGLFYVEATLSFEEGIHIMSISRRLLGRSGKIFATIIFLFINYASILAYISGGGSLIQVLLQHSIGFELSKPLAIFLFTAAFGTMIAFGTLFIEKVNGILFFALLISYLALIVMGITHVNFAYLLQKNWLFAPMTLPLMLTIYSYQAIIPSLAPYLDHDPKMLKKAIYFGMIISLLFFVVWEFVILGIVPYEGAYGLKAALKSGRGATEFLFHHLQGMRLFPYLANFFAFFAIITSFFGISLATYDFFADGFKVAKKGIRKVFLLLLVLIPPLFFSVKYTNLFELALELSGSFGDAMISGIIPALWVYSARYVHKLDQPYKVSGGKWTIGYVIAFSLLVLVVQIIKLNIG